MLRDVKMLIDVYSYTHTFLVGLHSVSSDDSNQIDISLLAVSGASEPLRQRRRIQSLANGMFVKHEISEFQNNWPNAHGCGKLTE